VLNNQGKEVASVKSMETVLFRVRIRVYEAVEKPIFGMMVKTKDGIELYGNNTLYMGMNIKPLLKGDELVVEYMIHFYLQAGDYFLSAGVAEMTAESILPLDRRYDFVFISVLPTDKSFGLVNLNTDIKIFYEPNVCISRIERSREGN
jgi:hypothetical protein